MTNVVQLRPAQDVQAESELDRLMKQPVRRETPEAEVSAAPNGPPNRLNEEIEKFFAQYGRLPTWEEMQPRAVYWRSRQEFKKL